jgi:hypothetical protein
VLLDGVVLADMAAVRSSLLLIVFAAVIGIGAVIGSFCV